MALDDSNFAYVPPSIRGHVNDADSAHIAAARESSAAFTSYVIRHEGTGRPVYLSRSQQEWHRLADVCNRLLVWCHVEGGKAVPLDTSIPTPNGWTTMGQLRLGDQVFARDGSPCRVVGLSAIQVPEIAYEVEFDDGDIVNACADHQWLMHSAKDLDVKKYTPRVVTTAQMVDKMQHGRSWMWKAPLAEPVQYPERDLPIPPYTLGVWLGNGTTAGAGVYNNVLDVDICDRCAAEVGECSREASPEKGVLYQRLGAFRGDFSGRLRALGVLNNKHVPAMYMVASVEQRRALLAGLLDTDGHLNNEKNKSRVEFCSTDKSLAESVLELARSLGFKVSFGEGRAMLNGVDYGPKYRVCFTAREPVFYAQRKLSKQRLGGYDGLRGRHRSVVAIRKVPACEMRCISVDSADHSYLMTHSYTVTHNTTNLSVSRPLWELGKNPNVRVMIVSNTDAQARKMSQLIGKYIEGSEELKRVFPRLKRAKNQPWNQHALNVERTSHAKDPSIQTCGIHGSVLGSRVDLLILDDILDYENTRSAAQRDEIWHWYQSTLEGRLTANARVLCVGTAWHREDIMHRFAKHSSWAAYRYPIINRFGQSAWPEVFPMERIEKRRQDLTPLEFSRQMMCQARSDEDARFKREWIDGCLARGEGMALKDQIWNLPEGYKTFTGVDLGLGYKNSDLTVFFTILLHPNGDREVCEVASGKWTGPEIVQRVLDTHQRYHSEIIIENNGGQEFLLQFTRKISAVPVRPYTTTAKTHGTTVYSVESMATEFYNMKWIIPCRGGRANSEIEAWISEILHYDPNSHAGDRVMACMFAREAARQERPKMEYGRI